MRPLQAVRLFWWAPTLALVVTGRLTFWAGYCYRIARANRLMEACDLDEAERVIARLRREVEAYRARMVGRISDGG